MTAVTDNGHWVTLDPLTRAANAHLYGAVRGVKVAQSVGGAVARHEPTV